MKTYFKTVNDPIPYSSQIMKTSILILSLVVTSVCLTSCGDPSEAVINIQLLKYDPTKLEQNELIRTLGDEWWASTAPFHLSKYQLEEKVHTSIKVSSVNWKLEEGLWYASGPGNSVYLPADPDAVQAIASFVESRN